MAAAYEALQSAVADRYRIEREIGRGGMATVYLAEDLKHHREVALKVLDAEVADGVGADRFLHEIEIAARLSHPHILPLFDSGAAEGQLYYVTPHVAGGSLRERLERERQLSLDEALELTREVAGALAHAHAQGVVHRDIKPENILLADGQALVADFGIARAVQTGGTRLTATGVMVGTPIYMSPEQATGGELDVRSDLYALACVLYEMLAGQPPFTGASPESLVHQHLAVPPRSVTELRPSVPEPVAAVIAQALAKTPADRPATAARFAEALGVAARAGRAPTRAPEVVETATPHNLPRDRTRFIGRERELAECARLFGEARLLTIIGVGGSGKTRLALRLAESLLDTFPDGVWFVDLAPLTDPIQVPEAVATVLGVKGRSDEPLIETLCRHAAGRRRLLVLDNCEHVIAACGELAERLLASDEKVRILATSREGLGVEGEQLFAQRSLGLPDDQSSDPTVLGGAEAVRLFVDRARTVSPAFALGPENAPAVADICRRLDGIPLAIELAASKVRALAVGEIRRRLDDRFRLLAGGSRALPRHQTLAAAIRWSYDLLESEDQRLFRALAVFAGGWTLEAAVAVAAADPGDEYAILESMIRLVDKSLVEVELTADGATRYRVLETFRQFAQERLIESGEAEATRARHEDFFARWAVEWGPDSERPQIERFPLLAREQANLEQALESALVAGRGQNALQIANGQGHYWRTRGYLATARRRLDQALGTAGAETRTQARARALYLACHVAILMSQSERAMGMAEESLSMAREIGNRRLEAASLNLLGLASYDRDDPRAAAYFGESLAVARAAGLLEVEAIVLSNQAMMAEERGDLAGARRLIEESFPSLDYYNQPEAHLFLARLALRLGEPERSVEPLLSALDIVRREGWQYVAPGVLEVAAGLAHAHGDARRAARALGASEALLREMGNPREPDNERYVREVRAGVRAVLGDEAYERARAEGAALSFEAAVDEAIVRLKSGAPGGTGDVEAPAGGAAGDDGMRKAPGVAPPSRGPL